MSSFILSSSPTWIWSRLPSGNFDTNYLMCRLAAVAIKLLRLVGKNTLNEPDAPVRYPAKRRCINTVMRVLMFKVAQMIHYAERWVFGLAESEPAFGVFERHYGQLGTSELSHAQIADKFKLDLARICQACIAVGKIGRTQRKPHGRATRMLWLSSGFDVGLRVHEMLSDYLNNLAEITFGWMGGADSGE